MTHVTPMIDAMVEKLVTHYQPEKIILFGSWAKGVQQADSDIDLLIIKETDQRFIKRWSAVRKILTDPQRRTPLDTLVLTPAEVKRRLDIGDQFVKEILSRGVILYEA